jgi:glutaminyl-tRNA synthetase
MTKEEVKVIVMKYVGSSEKAKESKWASLGKTTGELKKLEVLKWCNPIDLKSSVDESFLELFGPKDAQPTSTASSKPPTTTNPKPKKNVGSDSNPAALSASKETSAPAEPPSIFEVGMLSQLYPPGGNPQKDPKLTQDHLKATGAKVVTRFPPEPNGIFFLSRAIVHIF